MSLSLYHIDQALEALIDPETGELLDYDAFEQLQMDREHKIENMVCWSKSLDAEAKAIRDEEKELAERRRTMERKRDRTTLTARWTGTPSRRQSVPLPTARVRRWRSPTWRNWCGGAWTTAMTAR